MTTVPARASRARRRVWPWVVGGLAVVVAVFAALFAWDGWKLMSAADGLEEHAGAAQQAVTSRDADALASEVEAMQESSREFASHTSGLHWTVAGWLPWVKDQTLPLQQAGTSVQIVAEDALGPLSELDDLDALEVPPVQDGRIDPLVLEPYRETLAVAARVLAREREALAAVSLGGTVGAVREPFSALESDLGTLGELVQGAHVAAELLPPMLGADGARTYVVMVQNNAEPRSSGGIPGAAIELRAEDGVFTMGQYLPAGTMAQPGTLVAPLTDDEVRVFTERMAWYPQDVNFTPEFPRAAELMAAFWERENGERPDGVLSVDPVAMSYMLPGLEPFAIDGIDVTTDNLVDVLLNEVYFAYDSGPEADRFFAAASSVLFAQVLEQDGGTLTAGIERAAAEQRLLLWSADSDEQELLETTGIAGDFIARDDALGVFLSDGSGSKIGYYIETELDVVDHLCASDGSLHRQTITYQLDHTFDGDVDDLPRYVSGGDVYVPAGEFHANVRLIPPSQMGVTQFTRDGEAGTFNGELLHGRDVASARVLLLPGESKVLTFEVTARERGLRNEQVVQTPGIGSSAHTRTIDSQQDAC